MSRPVPRRAPGWTPMPSTRRSSTPNSGTACSSPACTGKAFAAFPNPGHQVPRRPSSANFVPARTPSEHRTGTSSQQHSVRDAVRAADGFCFGFSVGAAPAAARTRYQSRGRSCGVAATLRTQEPFAIGSQSCPGSLVCHGSQNLPRYRTQQVADLAAEMVRGGRRLAARHLRPRGTQLHPSRCRSGAALRTSPPDAEADRHT